ncbi:MAG: diphthine--ammonia ligase [Thermofilaceae archaeon]
MRVCVLYSGGKDSNLALLEASERHEVVCLVTLVPSSLESWLFHYPNVNLVPLQAEALGLPLMLRRCPDDEAGSLVALERALREAVESYGVEGVVTGAVKSRYQAERFAAVCRRLGLECINPLWGRSEVELLREVLRRRIEAIFTRVAGYPLSASLLGRKIDERVVEWLSGLAHIVNPSGEGGEYETFVLDMPLFNWRIEPVKWRVEGTDYDAVLIIESAELRARRS